MQNDDTFFVIGYEWDIYLSQLENEKKNFHEIARENSGIDFEKLRRILISWMIEVQVEFKLQAQSLFLAVNYVDRMLHIISTPTVALQLLGATSLFIAAKYEEIYPPNIEKFLFICDNMYSKQQMLSMEYQIINSLSFDLTSATIINFISLYLKVLGIDENYQEIYFLCYYLGELTLPIIEFRKFLPSKIAASIVCFAVYIYQNPNRDIKSWIKEFENIVQYKKEELLDCIHLLRNNIQNPGGGPNFVVQKFSEPEYGCIAEKIPKRNLSFC